MNSLIRDFEKQSGIEIFSLGLNRAKWELCLEEFSKMIVKECAAIANSNLDPETDYPIGEDILKHFGVEHD